MRTRLHLTDKELLDKSWIALSLEMQDFPWYDSKARKVISDTRETGLFLEKLKMQSNGLDTI
jgi:hypothetical protein